ncbi:MAG: hypothetical protein JRF33_05330 [Deltaproteobacteria bacterium]|nr:hypothetical protein [Deltaproteobacteria bacterium]
MRVPSEQQAMHQVAERLAELVNVDQSQIRFETSHDVPHADGIIEIGPFTFVVDWKGEGLAGPVAMGIEQVRRYAKKIDGAVPLVAVPYMGDAGRKRCAGADIAWLDLSGNARIFAPGLRILVEGKPNQYKKRGRPSSVFAPKSSRIARWLLMHPAEFVSQREIATATDTDEGYTSRIVGKLDQDGLIVRNTNGAIKPRDPDLLLDAWREAYTFSRHHIIRGHVAARTGDLLLRKLADALDHLSTDFAATGLAAAWLLDQFAGFRTTALYLAEEPSPKLLESLSFREEDRGANVWLVVPNDEGVFHGAVKNDGIRCVHPVQVYLDLGAHPERASEAAQRLRAAHLNWRTDA